MPLDPPKSCSLCPRLVALRKQNQARHPNWFNGAVPAFGDARARLLLVGLAPGLKGANRTGRVFTGDLAGKWLFAALKKLGLAEGDYAEDPGDSLVLRDCRIVNAVRCLPPDNKPSTEEIATCRQFLTAQLQRRPRARGILALGRVAHESSVRALNQRPSALPFRHGQAVALKPFTLVSSYHCSQRNISTKRLTPAMLEKVLRRAKALAQA